MIQVGSFIEASILFGALACLGLVVTVTVRDFFRSTVSRRRAKRDRAARLAAIKARR